MLESGIELPGEYASAMAVFQMLSPRTLDDDAAVTLWLETFRLSRDKEKVNGQGWIDTGRDRREALRTLQAPCRVISFGDDLITPPHLAAEVANAIPNCDLVEIPCCGHFGYLERPDEVNSAIIEFLDKN